MSGLSLAEVARHVEAELDLLIGPPGGEHARLIKAMRYSALNGGKRLRAWLVVATSVLFDVPRPAAIRVGAAIECMHAYSLIHDDLPAMDDALTRRGRPACHKAFGEATAILAGDALQALALEIIARDDYPARPEARVTLCLELARSAGVHGMCGGQMIDLLAETRQLGLDEITHLQSLKTGALFGFCCRAGGILGGGDKAALDALDGYAAALGLAFQITDDLLDLVGDEAAVGKDLGRDAERHKATFPSLLGIDGAKRRLDALRADGGNCLLAWGDRASHLIEMLDFVMNREV